MWKLLRKHTLLKNALIGEITGQSLCAFVNKKGMKKVSFGGKRIIMLNLYATVSPCWSGV